MNLTSLRHMIFGDTRGEKAQKLMRAGLLAAQNEVRAKYGIPLLRGDSRLKTAAMNHAAWMARTGVFSHTGANSSTPRLRVQASGYYAGIMTENIAWGFPDAQSVVNAWMNSPGHRFSIMEPRLLFVGLGHVADRTGAIYWVADYASLYQQPAQTIKASAEFDEAELRELLRAAESGLGPTELLITITPGGIKAT